MNKCRNYLLQFVPRHVLIHIIQPVLWKLNKRILQIKEAHKIFVRKPPGRQRHFYDDNIKMKLTKQDVMM